MAVRIRMKRLGRKNRPYYRIVAIDHHQPRDGRALEEVGTYDPMNKDKEARVTLKPARIKHWLSKGALPSDNVAIFIKKYMEKWEKIEAAAAVATEAPK